MGDPRGVELSVTRLLLGWGKVGPMAVHELAGWAQEFILAGANEADGLAPGALCHSRFGWLLWFQWRAPVGVEAQAEAIRRIGVEGSQAVGGAAMWREVPGRVVVDVSRAKREWNRLAGLVVEVWGGERWGVAVPLAKGEGEWEAGPLVTGLEEAVACWPALLNGRPKMGP